MLFSCYSCELICRSEKKKKSPKLYKRRRNYAEFTSEYLEESLHIIREGEMSYRDTSVIFLMNRSNFVL